MPRLSKKDVTRPSSGPASRFQRYDGFRFAVVAQSVLGGQPLCGRASFQRDDALGSILRISLEGDFAGRPEILIAENEWQGLITTGKSYGCDYCLTLIPEQPVAPASGAGQEATRKM